MPAPRIVRPWSQLRAGSAVSQAACEVRASTHSQAADGFFPCRDHERGTARDRERLTVQLHEGRRADCIWPAYGVSTLMYHCSITSAPTWSLTNELSLPNTSNDRRSSSRSRTALRVVDLLQEFEGLDVVAGLSSVGLAVGVPSAARRSRASTVADQPVARVETQRRTACRSAPCTSS